MTKCAIYCRVSTKEQVTEGNSLLTQEKACREYAYRLGYTKNDIRVFSEEGESAKTASRPILTELIEFCRKSHKEVDVLIFYTVDRLARNTNDYTSLRALFNTWKINVHSVTEKLEDSPSGRFLETILAAKSQLDNEERAMKCQGGMVEAVKEGRYISKAPVGYKNGKHNGKKNIEPDEPQAYYVKKAFELIASRTYHPEEVRRVLAREGFKNPKGKAFSTAHFHRMIRNPIYMGVITSFDLQIKGDFVPLISSILFYKTQDILNTRKREISPSYTINSPEFPLRKFLVCGDCGSSYTGSASVGNGGKYSNYRCRGCRGKGTTKSREMVHSAFKTYLESLQYSKEEVECLKITIELNLQRRDEFRRHKLIHVTESIEQKVSDRKALVIKDIRNEYNNTQVIKDLLDELDNDIAVLELQKQELLSAEPDLDKVVEYGLSFMRTLGDRWQKADLPTKQRFQKFLFPEGVIYYQNEKFGTIPSLRLIELKKTLSEKESLLVDLRGVEPLSKRGQS